MKVGPKSSLRLFLHRAFQLFVFMSNNYEQNWTTQKRPITNLL